MKCLPMIRLCVTTALLLAVALPCTASAAANAGSSGSLAKQARIAYDKSEFSRAAGLFYDAWLADKSQVSLLFSAALAAKSAGQLDNARQWLVQYLELVGPGGDAARIERAKAALQQVQAEAGRRRSSEAADAARSGDHALAAAKYVDAYKVDPAGQPAALYNAAVSYEALGDVAAAKAALERYLQVAPTDAPERVAAQTRLKRLSAAQPTAKPAAQAGATPDPAASPVKDRSAAPAARPVASAVAAGGEAGGGRSVGPWVVAGVGAAMAIGGTLYYLSANGDAQSATNENNPANWDIAKTGTQTGSSIAFVGLAAVAGGLTWWAASAPAAPQVAVSPRALQLAWRF